ncbi:MAG: dephospho-CoA kinase [Flavobacterium sp.]|nr:dephospho-CoA kinase [Flavobacterium sp.]
MTKVIGLTGGIGSGKTTVSKMFEALGVPVYNSDSEAKKIMLLPETIVLLKSNFGNDFFENDILNRKKLADLVFKNPEKLKELNSIVHPFVKKDFIVWLKKNENEKFVIKESAILFESKTNINCDKIITVIAPLYLRMQRIVERDNLVFHEIVKRINNQLSDEKKVEKSDFVIENTDLEMTKNHVLKIYEILNL